MPVDRAELALQDALVCFSPTLGSERRDKKNFPDDGFHDEIGRRPLLVEVLLNSWMQTNGWIAVSRCRPAHADHFDAKTLWVSSNFIEIRCRYDCPRFCQKLSKSKKS